MFLGMYGGVKERCNLLLHEIAHTQGSEATKRDADKIDLEVTKAVLFLR
jgi:hypothetical protein